MAVLHSEKIITDYTETYKKLYKRSPKDLQVIDKDWVIVNGARMRVSDLAVLTQQLQQQYKIEKRGVIMRLVNWFKGM